MTIKIWTEKILYKWKLKMSLRRWHFFKDIKKNYFEIEFFSLLAISKIWPFGITFYFLPASPPFAIHLLLSISLSLCDLSIRVCTYLSLGTFLSNLPFSLFICLPFSLSATPSLSNCLCLYLYVHPFLPPS